MYCHCHSSQSEICKPAYSSSSATFKCIRLPPADHRSRRRRWIRSFWDVAARQRAAVSEGSPYNDVPYDILHQFNFGSSPQLEQRSIEIPFMLKKKAEQWWRLQSHKGVKKLSLCLNPGLKLLRKESWEVWESRYNISYILSTTYHRCRVELGPWLLLENTPQ